MLLTETEAKERWCPMARVVSWDSDARVHVAGNRVATNVTSEPEESELTKTSLCIASGCAMWRWRVATTLKLGPVATKQGYCGLAGAPAYYTAVGDPAHKPPAERRMESHGSFRR